MTELEIYNDLIKNNVTVDCPHLSYQQERLLGQMKTGDYECKKCGYTASPQVFLNERSMNIENMISIHSKLKTQQ